MLLVFISPSLEWRVSVHIWNLIKYFEFAIFNSLINSHKTLITVGGVKTAPEYHVPRWFCYTSHTLLLISKYSIKDIPVTKLLRETIEYFPLMTDDNRFNTELLVVWYNIADIGVEQAKQYNHGGEGVVSKARDTEIWSSEMNRYIIHFAVVKKSFSSKKKKLDKICKSNQPTIWYTWKHTKHLLSH